MGDRNVFFFVSGGVDSTVAFTLCLRALGPERVRGIYVDTGLMREGETDFVRGIFRRCGGARSRSSTPRSSSWARSPASRDPEAEAPHHRRGVRAGAGAHHRIRATCWTSDWILGQGTIYPDTIESGGTAKAAVIKTHHNRVAGIQKLIEAGRIVEPLSSFYKDEVREVGRELGLPRNCSSGIPFPGPGSPSAACARSPTSPCAETDGGLDCCRCTRWACRAIRAATRRCWPDRFPSPEADLQQAATELINRISGINRVVARVGEPSAARRDAGARQLADRRAAGPPAARRRHRAPPVARERLRPRGLAIPGDPDPAGHGRSARFGGAAAGAIPWTA